MKRSWKNCLAEFAAEQYRRLWRDASWPAALARWLEKRANNHKENLQRLITGAGTFFIGAALIVFADKAIPPSLEQELLALFATGLCALGILLALAGYLSLSILRLLHFFHKD